MTPIRFTNADIEAALAPGFARAVSGNRDTVYTGVSTDSRSIRANELFVAISGDNFDGNTFICDLLEKGTKGFVAGKGFFQTLSENQQAAFQTSGAALFEVENTVTALGRLAGYQRGRAKAGIAAITGSNGKTTTRKIAWQIFDRAFQTLATQGNLNNEIGLPLTLLKLGYGHDWAVVEMGMNHPGEISRLSAIARPDIAIITNTADAHLEGVGDVTSVALAKSEIFSHANAGGIAVLNRDDPRFDIMSSKARENTAISDVVTFSTEANPDADVKAESIETGGNQTRFSLTHDRIGEIDLVINSPARFMVSNALAACTAAIYAGIGPEEIRKGLAAFTPVSGRMRITELTDRVTLIDDAYNANPESVKRALETLGELSINGTAIAVLGDMFELGAQAERLHEETGKAAALNGMAKIYCTGDLSEYIIEGALKTRFPEKNTFRGTKDAIVDRLKSDLQSDRVWILVKGSRGMKMEEIIDRLKAAVANRKKGA